MNHFLGRWDVVVDSTGQPFPSWLEVTESGGRFVGRVGSARPLKNVQIDGDKLAFSLPPQYEQRDGDLEFQGQWIKNRLFGTTTLDDGSKAKWVADRAPALPKSTSAWGPATDLIGPDLSNWHVRTPEWENHWSIAEGALANAAKGTDLVTNDRFADFRLVAEYRYPKGSNSGIYLRGRYEFQIVDDYESQGHGVGNSGAIYGCIAPIRNAVHPPDEWNRVEIELSGRWVWVDLNGVRIIDSKEIPGITGGALDCAEGQPGPIFLQGDHGPVTFRKLSISPQL